MKVAFISDVHGNWDAYRTICEGYENTIQVGDFGMGFESIANGMVPYLSQNHRFIRGNHDDPAKCRAHPNYIADGTIEIVGSSKVMFIGGAQSVDRCNRTEGVDWWSDEECNYMQWQQFIDLYESEKPDVMITHDFPNDFAQRFILKAHKPLHPSITGNALNVMSKIHSPKIWIAGHWHLKFNYTFRDTEFICRRDIHDTNQEVFTLDL